MHKPKAILRKKDEFSSVFNFRKRLSAKFIVLHYQPNALRHARLGLVVGKKIAKSSVKRNYMRRVLRECFRLTSAQIAPVDLIIRVQQTFDQRSFAIVNQEFLSLIAQINKRCKAHILPNSVESHTTL